MEKYIKKQEYRAAKGVDLDLELHGMDDPSNKADRLIKDITDWCVSWLEANYRAYELEDWPDEGDPTSDLLTIKRQRLFRMGVMDQIEYVLQNGNIAQHSGVNATTFAITDFSGIEMSRSALLKFRVAGFANI